MVQITQFFQPPLYWQQFEDLIAEVSKEVYSLAHADKIGRPGQSQSGVDVHGKSARFGHIGIQCKRMSSLDENNNPLPGGSISKALIQKEAKKAESFAPTLDFWIIATTAKRDAKTQKVVRELNEEIGKSRKFTIIAWFWDDLVSMLNSFPTIQRDYYRDVINIQSKNDQDTLILRTISKSFDRPAFSDPITGEVQEDFEKAIADTIRALKTGELVDRIERHVIERSLGGWADISNSVWRASIKDVENQLRETRTQIRKGLSNGDLLVNRHGYIEEKFIGAAMPASDARRNCISSLNSVLQLATLSELPLPP